MEKYKVVISPKAIKELESIYDYITHTILAPESAKKLTNQIKHDILNMSTFPMSHQDRIEGNYAGKNYKQLLVDKYIVIFRINEIDKTVLVVTIQYQGRNI
ncbi:plasmid stabilization system protein ParE [Breznakia blatticola]|uniref:Plasmid stabilization system protein ParE n=1 Tax=Breznakia blatticola TaxID=1754012 RepID=A0A4R7ZIJ8_9FIRM|nr:type II toxin-antitoxin system RelE/ParE family toxin [Breznakia blatticola]TDW16261.1 plasmid stabilization system protein ParE [Breznakia blatticola]